MNPLSSLFAGQPATPPSSNNPLLTLLAAMSNGQNPINAISTISPQLAQLLQSRGNQSIEQFVRNEYQKRGINIDAALQQVQALMGNNNIQK